MSSISVSTFQTSDQNRFNLLVLLCIGLFCLAGCGGASASAGSQPPVVPAAQVATPTIATTPAQSGAVIVSLLDTTSGSSLYYTLDGSTPSAGSIRYLAPFLLSSNASVSVIGTASGQTNSAIASKTLSLSTAPGSLIWSDEFTNSTGAIAQPNPATWGYDTGASGYGNNELEDYCAWGSNAAPCSAAAPNAYVGLDNYLHISARQPTSGSYTSARLKTQGLFSFHYGRLEFRAKVPEAKGLWPAGWLLGNTIDTLGWPACGEQDVLERVGAATVPDFNQGSVHGPGFVGVPLGSAFHFTAGQTASGWHTYGMIWKPGSVSFYVDDPANIYAAFGPADLSAYPGSSWPFDSAQGNFIILNLAVGGQWPGPPDSSTPFPSELLVDYVRVYAN